MANHWQEMTEHLQEMAQNVKGKMSAHSIKEQHHKIKLKAYTQQIQHLESEMERFEGTLQEIEARMGEDITEATMEKLEEMSERVTEKIDSLQERIDELQEKIDESEEEYEHYVDEDIIGQLSNLPGLGPEIKPSREPGTQDTCKIDVEVFREYERKYANISQEERENRRNYRRQSRYNVNFCANATIDSFCCAHNNNERPENLIDDDYGLKTKWCASKSHITWSNMDPHWVIIDLGSEETFNYVQIIKASPGKVDRWRHELDMAAWRIEVSHDKETWTEFNRETDDATDIYEKMFQHQQGRYVRLLIDAAEADPNNKAATVRIYQFTLKMIDTNGKERNITARAHIDSFSSQNSSEMAKNILNDNMRRKWCAGVNNANRIALPHWVIIDFGASRTFNQLRMVKASGGGEARHYNMSAWRFEVSDDKQEWTEFNKETNDQSDIYVKTFEERTGRYIRLLVDAAERDPGNKNGHVRIYDLRIEMAETDTSDNTVTFDDIIDIAPFAKRETVDKLVEKLAKIERLDFSKIQAVSQYLTENAVDKLISEAFERDDFSAIFALAPHASKGAVEKIALTMDSTVELDKIKALTPFLGKEAIAGILISSGQLTMSNLRALAPILGSELIDELLRKYWGE